ncbi:LodA/GoxA family CTQ-dependent oxidase [Sulfidibacter corallicola]|uniref:LodA/GoxA family CTQ-dependent oxidase n=1 Tax=Sulfidibacter corallicola TaxID=2818388 RepID=A0A8A4TGX4_SULCO|nr:LodA/GoxA family CTQ-dependent oxidase [Sulfidibacter corallicola]QTD49319.1 LodA/GoxA family CTQ-dependent oxidase [Sulfidibacter corallicola]
MTQVFRIHPAIGFARVGNSEEYYLQPETIAGLPVPDGLPPTSGGLPIKAGTEDTPITSDDVRDRFGQLKRQAARFRVFEYDLEKTPERYPNHGGRELELGKTKVDGKNVVDIVWTVHTANKKANNYVLENPELKPFEQMIDGYAQGALPPIRNPQEGDDLNNPARIRRLVIDPGPRAIKGCSAPKVDLDRTTPASYGCGAEIVTKYDYPKSFPGDSFNRLYAPDGEIDTLGQIETDEQGRLIFAPAYGRANSWTRGDAPGPLTEPVDNDGWFDDTCDGPVRAVLVLEDGSTVDTVGAWVISTDPGYAPQTLNVVSLWDDIYDTWVRKLQLAPEIYDTRFNKKYQPDFAEHIYPIFRAAALQRWNTNLPELAIRSHDAVGAISADDHPAQTILGGLGFIRNPNISSQNVVGAPLMPLSLGDQGKPFLSPSFTQYFFLEQWNAGTFKKGGYTLGKGEALDRAVLMNCLGGRFSPGIDMTFIVRQPGLYITHWNCSGVGPFRINGKHFDYAAVQPSQPLLTEGWVPCHTPLGPHIEPGDTSKFMSIPWHTDYNSCAVHQTDPNPDDSTTVYWSWPAQRPVAVYVAAEASGDALGPQRFSVRGPGTFTDNPAQEGRYQEYLDFVENWPKVGMIMTGSQITTGTYDPEHFLEVESLLDAPGVQPWPQNAKPDDDD